MTKPLTFRQWLLNAEEVTPAQLNGLALQYANAARTAYRDQIQKGAHVGFTTHPIDFDAFLARKYPRQFRAYYGYLRVVGATKSL